VPDISNDVRETHYEWLLRTIARADRRETPFVYGEADDSFERRKWDIRDSAPPR
jgi:hypothetical protein